MGKHAALGLIEGACVCKVLAQLTNTLVAESTLHA